MNLIYQCWLHKTTLTSIYLEPCGLSMNNNNWEIFVPFFFFFFAPRVLEAKQVERSARELWRETRTHIYIYNIYVYMLMRFNKLKWNVYDHMASLMEHSTSTTSITNNKVQIQSHQRVLPSSTSIPTQVLLFSFQHILGFVLSLSLSRTFSCIFIFFLYFLSASSWSCCSVIYCSCSSFLSNQNFVFNFFFSHTFFFPVNALK